jgi:hypothetical protein
MAKPSTQLITFIVGVGVSLLHQAPVGISRLSVYSTRAVTAHLNQLESACGVKGK